MISPRCGACVALTKSAPRERRRCARAFSTTSRNISLELLTGSPPIRPVRVTVSCFGGIDRITIASIVFCCSVVLSTPGGGGVTVAGITIAGSTVVVTVVLCELVDCAAAIPPVAARTNAQAVIAHFMKRLLGTETRAVVRTQIIRRRCLNWHRGRLA
jgi:hypothetical protein